MEKGLRAAMIYRIIGNPTVPEWSIHALHYTPNILITLGTVYEDRPNVFAVFLDDSSLKLGDDATMKLLAVGRNMILSHFMSKRKNQPRWYNDMGQI